MASSSSSSSSPSLPVLVSSPSANSNAYVSRDAPDPAAANPAAGILPAMQGALTFGKRGARGGDNMDAVPRVQDLEDRLSAIATEVLGEPWRVPLHRDADSSEESSSDSVNTGGKKLKMRLPLPLLLLLLLLFHFPAPGSPFSNGAPWLCDPMSELFGCEDNTTGVPLPSAGSGRPANKRCKANGQIMWWVGAPRRSPDYTVRAGDGLDATTDPTTYAPSTYMHVFVRVRRQGRLYGGILLRATDTATGRVVGRFDVPKKNNHPYWTPNSCPGAVLHATGELKPYLAEFLFKTPPEGTGEILFQALIKRGEANTGEFYYPQEDLRLAERPAAVSPGATPAASEWNMTDPGESCDQFCSLRFGPTEFASVCDDERMAAMSNSTAALSASNAGKYPLFEPLVKDCGRLAPAIRESDDMTFYFEPACATSRTPSCYAYADGIRRLCLCKKRQTSGEEEEYIARSPGSRRRPLRGLLAPLTAIVLVLYTLSSVPTPGTAHNWVETPSRARSRASTTRPCQIRKASDLHAQIGAKQNHVIKFAMGHGSTSYWAVVKGKDEHWLSHPDFKKMLMDYLDNAPESVNQAFEPKYKRYHAYDLSCDTTTDDAGCLKSYMDMTNPDTVKDSTIVPNNGWCDKSDLKTCALFSRRVPSTDPNFVDHALEPTEWMSGTQKRGALFEYRESALRAGKDKRVYYKSDEYPWLVGAHSYLHLAHMPSTVDAFRVDLPQGSDAGHYVINWWWAGYYDAVDFDYMPSFNEVTHIYGDVECAAGQTKSDKCAAASPLKPCCPDSRSDKCANTRFCTASPPVFNKIDHCQYVNPSMFITQAKVLGKDADVQTCLDEINSDWQGVGAPVPLNRAGVVVSPLELPSIVAVQDALLEAARRNATAMMKHTNNVAPLSGTGKDALTPVHWNSWFGTGSASSEAGKTCQSFAYRSGESRYYFLGSLREAVLRCSNHQCRGVVWKPSAGVVHPGALYDEHPDPPLQFQFCGGDGSLIAATDGSIAVMKSPDEQWKSGVTDAQKGPLIRINFMPKASNLSLPAGWKKDVGEKFGNRGGGQQYGWTHDLSDPDALSGVSPTCNSGSCKNTRAVHTYLQTATWTSKDTSAARTRDRTTPATRSTDVYDKDRAPSLDTTMFVFQYYNGERVPRRALDPSSVAQTLDYSVDRPPLRWSYKVPNGVYNVSIMTSWDVFFHTSSMSRMMSGGCTVEESKVDYYDWQWKARNGGGAAEKFTDYNPTAHDGPERKYHIRNIVVVVRDGKLDVSTSATVIQTENDNIRFSATPRCHSISWIEFQQIATYDMSGSTSGKYPDAWFPSSEAPWFQRDLGGPQGKAVRMVRLTPPSAPRNIDSQRKLYEDRYRNSPHPSYTGRGQHDDNPYDTCRSRWLFDGDSCVDDEKRGREMGSWDHTEKGMYGYTVSVGDVPCDPSSTQPCLPDPDAHVCRPLPGLSEWSLGAPEYNEKLAIIDQKIPRPQTPTRPETSTWSILQLNYYHPFSENGQGDMTQLAPLVHDCGDHKGRYVRVQLHGKRRILDVRVDVVGTDIAVPAGIDRSDAKLCYGVMARAARSLPTPLMEYQVSKDPHDPIYYSTCYVREPKRLWETQNWHEDVPAVRDFRLETTCLQCDSYQASLENVLNQTYVPHWVIDETCTNCDSTGINFSVLAYQEHSPLEPPPTEDDYDGTMKTIIGIAVGGGLCFVLAAAGAVVYLRGGNERGRGDRVGSIQLKESSYSPNARKSYLAEQQEKTLETQRNSARASQFYSSNREILDRDTRAEFKDYTRRRTQSGAQRPQSVVIDRRSAESEHPRVVSLRKAKEGSMDACSAWQQHIDEENQIYYYFNEVTCKSMWDPPEAGFKPCEWQIEIDYETGTAFYSNTEDGTTSWSGPAGFESANPMMKS